MVDVRALPSPPIRPEVEHADIAAGTIGEVRQPRSVLAQVLDRTWVRRTIVLVVVALVWEIYARFINNPLLFPTFSAVVAALWDATVAGPLLARIWYSIKILVMGYTIGVVLAALLTSLAVSTRVGSDILSTFTSMFNPLPAIALLPLSLMWFGLGVGSIVFVTVHSVLWTVALNMNSGFRSVPDAQRMAGRNYGLRGLRFVALILMPAAFPSILSGLKIGWAFAWRTLIAAELVFGASSSSGGVGWFIFEARNQLETSRVFAGLLAVIIIGLIVENLIFRTLEARTVVRWGMQR
ncbi:MAG: ABC transporter permease [Candidatus Velthaea sp.]